MIDFLVLMATYKIRLSHNNITVLNNYCTINNNCVTAATGCVLLCPPESSALTVIINGTVLIISMMKEI